MLIAPIPAAVTVAWLMPILAWWALQVLLLPAGSSAEFVALSDAALQVILGLQLATVFLIFIGWSGASRISRDTVRWRTIPSVSFSALVPAWPLLLTLCLVTGNVVTKVLYTQFLLFIAASAIVFAGQRFVRLPMTPGSIRLLQSGLGVIAGVTAWQLRAYLVPWTG